MRRILARPEQPSLLNTLTERFPLFSYAGRHAADLWLVGAPLSMGEYRDQRFQALLAGNADLPNDGARREAFNDAFAGQIALSIARQSRAEVSHEH